MPILVGQFSIQRCRAPDGQAVLRLKVGRLTASSAAADELPVLVAPAAAPAGCSTHMLMNALAGIRLRPPAQTQHAGRMELFGALYRTLLGSASAEHPNASHVRTGPWTIGGTQG
jgi:hypothetical protein